MPNTNRNRRITRKSNIAQRPVAVEGILFDVTEELDLDALDELSTDGEWSLESDVTVQEWDSEWASDKITVPINLRGLVNAVESGVLR